MKSCQHHDKWNIFKYTPTPMCQLLNSTCLKQQHNNEQPTTIKPCKGGGLPTCVFAFTAFSSCLLSSVSNWASHLHSRQENKKESVKILSMRLHGQQIPEPTKHLKITVHTKNKKSTPTRSLQVSNGKKSFFIL